MRKWLCYLALLSAAQIAVAPTAFAESPEEIEQRLKALEEALEKQQKIILEQQRLLDQQQQRLSTLDDAQLELQRGAGARQSSPTPQPATPPAGTGQAPATTPPDQPVGEAPEEERPEVTVLTDVGGVLTPTGSLVVEPSLDYSHSNVNRLTFRGVELQETVLIGVIEASDADRDLFSPAMTLRYGVFRDFEIEAKVPYVFRDDRITFLVPQAGEEDINRSDSLSGDGLGDIEIAGHYQITNTSPFVVANLRFKSTTGEGPFDVKRDSFGIEEELPTGSGFYSVEPSMTVIFPTDPAVLFGSLSYQWNFEDDVKEEIGNVTVRDVDPGDAIGLALGMGFSVNDDFSFSLGYKHTLVLGTETEIETELGTRHEKSNTLHVGSFLVGAGYRVSDDVGVNLDLELGATDDAPDMRALLRVPVSFDLFQ
jgi:hypothetical protein